MDVAKIPHIVSRLHFKLCENRNIMDEQEDGKDAGREPSTENRTQPNWLKDAKKRQKSMLEQLEALVSIESPSEDKNAVDRCESRGGGLVRGAGRKNSLASAEKIWRFAGSTIRRDGAGIERAWRGAAQADFVVRPSGYGVADGNTREDAVSSGERKSVRAGCVRHEGWRGDGDARDGDVARAATRRRRRWWCCW